MSAPWYTFREPPGKCSLVEKAGLQSARFSDVSQLCHNEPEAYIATLE